MRPSVIFNSDLCSKVLLIIFTLTWETRAVRKYVLYPSISLVFFWCLKTPPTFISNIKDVTRWLRYKTLQDVTRQLEIPFHRGSGRQRRGSGFNALAQVIGRTENPFFCKYLVPAAKLVGANLLEFAAPEKAEVVSGTKKFKTAAKSVRRQTMR